MYDLEVGEIFHFEYLSPRKSDAVGAGGLAEGASMAPAGADKEDKQVCVVRAGPVMFEEDHCVRHFRVLHVLQSTQDVYQW